jgi:hypothetical protein
MLISLAKANIVTQVYVWVAHSDLNGANFNFIYAR